MILTGRRLLWYLIHHLSAWKQFTLIEPQRDATPVISALDVVVQTYLRSSEKHPLFDEPVLIWWSDADHALLIPCRIQPNGAHLIEDAKAFRLVRTHLPAQNGEQTDAQEKG